MKERLVENWLTSTNERGFEIPFTQVLALKGHTILQGPVHHGHEHGKDLITVNKKGQLCAFQLKGGSGKFQLADLERHQHQLFALASTAVMDPSLRWPRRPDRVFLISNQEFTPPARSRLEQLSLGNRSDNLPAIEFFQKDRLVGDFVAAHGRFFPEQPTEVSNFLKIYMSDGVGFFESEKFLEFLESLFSTIGSKTGKKRVSRILASAALITGYLTSPWQRKENHAGLAEGWLLLASQILRIAATFRLESRYWRTTYTLAMEAAREALQGLLKEAVEARDLIVDGITESMVYAPRAVLVCGLLSAYFLSESIQGRGAALASDLRGLLQREMPYFKIVGESTIPHWHSVALALTQLGEIREAQSMVMSWAFSIASMNQPRSKSPVPNPYSTTRDILHSILDQLENRPGGFSKERFDGHSYTLHIAIEWLARRLCRQSLSAFWDKVTRISLCEYEPGAPEGYLRAKDETGLLKQRQYPRPTSWDALRKSSEILQKESIPAILWQQREFLPFLPLSFPNRFTSNVAKALDHVVM